MHDLVLEGVGKSYGSVLAVTDVDLHIPAGKLVCFLGPSGCGKTTLLRLIAGLEQPSRGRLLLDGADISGLPPDRRGFGMVFQSLALFDHLTVGDNIAYALRIRGEGKDSQRRRAEELLEMVRLPGVADRHVSQLSGGQRQRVAIARALAVDPKLFLLDEPLSALDAKLREAMQIELRLLQQRLAVTTILVTHDQREAMTMADLIVVMGDHRVQQVGAPSQIYREPANTFVADFIGTSNLLPVTVEAGAVQFGDRRITVAAIPDGLRRGQPATLLVRPEELHVLPTPDAAGEALPNRLPATVTFVRDVGGTVEVHVDCQGHALIAESLRKDAAPVAPGDAVTVDLPREACRVLAA
ncbi:ABC transporter ATP-binding protein [Caenispirillum bisanense]|uniref:Putative spermidine/putrescine transport system ATP-binding protein n=1 Tax=Caenispirillum bisanense TaxID=414052 RepID=A0A286GQQ9_9PROT|nr:ABC transporter ATP-binding protein [Caenispirillum bisanense]SOD97848.1 putative spermidine/putrescine transport system ATP-binding protein [Caenispirillum bisanense]